MIPFGYIHLIGGIITYIVFMSISYKINLDEFGKDMMPYYWYSSLICLALAFVWFISVPVILVSLIPVGVVKLFRKIKHDRECTGNK